MEGVTHSRDRPTNPNLYTSHVADCEIAKQFPYHVGVADIFYLYYLEKIALYIQQLKKEHTLFAVVFNGETGDTKLRQRTCFLCRFVL